MAILCVILPIRASSELFTSSEKRLGTGPAKTSPSLSDASKGQDSNSSVGTLSLSRKYGYKIYNLIINRIISTPGGYVPLTL